MSRLGVFGIACLAAMGCETRDREVDEQGLEREGRFEREERVEGVRAESRRDLVLAIDQAEQRIGRIRARGNLTEAEREELDQAAARLREVQRDLDAAREGAGWDATSDQLRMRVRRIDKTLDRIVEESADDAA